MNIEQFLQKEVVSMNNEELDATMNEVKDYILDNAVYPHLTEN